MKKKVRRYDAGEKENVVDFTSLDLAIWSIC